MSKIFSARKAGVKMDLPHKEVIRRIRRGDIQAKKLDWNWIVTEEAIVEAMNSDWYKRRQSRQASEAAASS